MRNKKLANSITVWQIVCALIKLIPQLPFKLYYLEKMLHTSKKKHYSWGVFFEEQVTLYPNKIALKGIEEFTYSEVNASANQLARYLSQRGVQQGSVVPCLMQNCATQVIVFIALVKLGATASMIPTSMRGSALREAVHSSPFPLMILCDDFREILPTLDLDSDKVLTVPSLWKAANKGDDFPYMGELCSYSKENLPATNRIESNAIAAYIFTSGTTGKGAKAALVQHARLVRSAFWFGKVVQHTTPEDTFYSPLPFYHSSSLVMGWPAAVAGGAAYVMEDAFSVSSFWDKVVTWQVTVLVYVGEILTYLVDRKFERPIKGVSLRRLLGNGLRVGLWDDVVKHLGVDEIYEMYGATESSQVFSNILNLKETIGMNFEKYRIIRYDGERDTVIRGADGYAQKVSKGDVGLFVYPVKKSQFRAYLSHRDTSDKLFHDLFQKGDCWFNSGDLLQDLGYKHARFIDRLGDTYRWKGENCSTREVESIIYDSFPDVLAVVVFGVSLERYDGRAGMIVLEDGNASIIPQLGALFKRELITEAIPRFVRLVVSLDMTESYKVKKSHLQKEGITTSDAIYVWDRKEELYRPLTPTDREQIQCGKLYL